MGLIIEPDTALGKELAKWNKPYVFRPFPKMLYQAQKRPDGVISVMETRDDLCGGSPGAAETFNRRGQMFVHDESELTKALEGPWATTPDEAKDKFETREQRIATEAAHRAHDDRNMSDKAKAEVKAAEDDTEGHLPELPRQPVRRGRPKGSKNKPKPS